VGWPVIHGHGQAIPLPLPGPKAMPAASARAADALASNFTRRDEFDGKLGPEWITVHVPKSGGSAHLDGGRLHLAAVHDATLADQRNAGFLARRQQHRNIDATTELAVFEPGIVAGLAAFQNERDWFFLGIRAAGPGIEVFLRRAAGAAAEDVARASVAKTPEHRLKLRITGAGPDYSFYYDAGAGWQPLREHEDGTILSTEKAGGFVGTVIGPYAQEKTDK
jgi:alpha-N-arabinofuranosidase